MPEIKEGEFFDKRLKDQSVEMSVVPKERQKMIANNGSAFQGF